MPASKWWANQFRLFFASGYVGSARVRLKDAICAIEPEAADTGSDLYRKIRTSDFANRPFSA